MRYDCLNSVLHFYVRTIDEEATNHLDLDMDYVIKDNLGVQKADNAT